MLLFKNAVFTENTLEKSAFYGILYNRYIFFTVFHNIYKTG